MRNMMRFDRDRYFWNNRPLSRSLFVEYDDSSPLFSIENRELADKLSLVCLKDEYVKYCSHDPSEFFFAEEMFPSWDYWVGLSESTYFSPYVQKWREENKVRQKAKALSVIVDTAADSKNRNRFSAAKWLYENEYTATKKVVKAGKEKDETKMAIIDDAKRLMEQRTKH